MEIDAGESFGQKQFKPFVGMLRMFKTQAMLGLGCHQSIEAVKVHVMDGRAREGMQN